MIFFAFLFFFGFVVFVLIHAETLASNNTCFSMVDGDYALDYKFSAPYNGILSGVRLVHNAGGITCNGGELTNWGCVTDNSIRTNVLKISSSETSSRNGVTLYPTGSDTDDIDITSTSSCGDATFYWYRMSLYDYSSDQLILYSSSTTYQVSKNESFILGAKEPVCGSSTSDNEGTTCATIYFMYSQIDDDYATG